MIPFVSLTHRKCPYSHSLNKEPRLGRASPELAWDSLRSHIRIMLVFFEDTSDNGEMALNMLVGTSELKWILYTSVSGSGLILGSTSGSHTCLHSKTSTGNDQYCECISIFLYENYTPKANWLMQKKETLLAYVTKKTKGDMTLDMAESCSVSTSRLLSSLSPSFSGSTWCVPCSLTLAAPTERGSSSLKYPNNIPAGLVSSDCCWRVPCSFWAYHHGTQAVMLWPGSVTCVVVALAWSELQDWGGSSRIPRRSYQKQKQRWPFLCLLETLCKL